MGESLVDHLDTHPGPALLYQADFIQLCRVEQDQVATTLALSQGRVAVGGGQSRSVLWPLISWTNRYPWLGRSTAR